MSTDLKRSTVVVVAAAMCLIASLSIESRFAPQLQIAQLPRMPLFLGMVVLAFALVWPRGRWTSLRRTIGVALAFIALAVFALLQWMDQIPISCALSTQGCDNLPVSVVGGSYRAWGWIALGLVSPLLFGAALIPSSWLRGRMPSEPEASIEQRPA